MKRFILSLALTTILFTTPSVSANMFTDWWYGTDKSAKQAETVARPARGVQAIKGQPAWVEWQPTSDLTPAEKKN